jgi:oxygen-dependent protoporphyrinogen oxidase
MAAHPHVAGGRRPRVAIIGGGMTGLGAARKLESLRAAGASFDWVLFERDDHFGGKVQTVRRDGYVIEGGPDSAIIEKPWPITTARELGIEDRLLNSNEEIRKSYVYSGGRIHELPEGIVLMIPTRLVPFALSSLISWPGKIRMGMDLLLPRGPAQDDESLGDFVRRRLGREALAKVAEPIVAGIHAGDPEQMSVRATFPMFHEMEQQYRSLIIGMLQRRRKRARLQAQALAAQSGGAGVSLPAKPQPKRSYFYSFVTGLADLPDAMVASLPADNLRYGAAVSAIERRGAPGAAGGSSTAAGSAAVASVPGGQDVGYVLTLADGSHEVCDAIVLAAPAWASGALLRVVAPRAAADLESIAYVSTATVSLAYRRDQIANMPSGFGVVVPRAEKRPLMAVTFSSSKFAHRAPADRILLRGFVGRAGAEEAAQLDDAEMVRVVRRELASMLGIAAEPELSEVFRWPQGMPQYRVGHVSLVDRIEREIATLPGIELAGGAYHGIGIGDCLREGAAAAERAFDHVSGLPEAGVPAASADVPAGDGVEDQPAG